MNLVRHALLSHLPLPVLLLIGRRARLLPAKISAFVIADVSASRLNLRKKVLLQGMRKGEDY